MKIFITGADGFIGSHLVELLLKKNYKVFALCHYNSHGSIGWLDEINSKQSKNLKILTGDINDSIFCSNMLKGKDVLINLASLISIPHSYESPRAHFETNTNGILNLAQSCMKNKIKKIIHISTSEVYGTAQYVPIDEKHILQPQSPYSASKISAEGIFRSFYYSYNLPVVILRLFNTFGPRQSIRAVIPKIITQVLSTDKNIILGDTKPTRDFNFVTDTCKAIECSIKKTKTGEIYNYGSGKEISIKKIVELVLKISGKNKKIVQDKKNFRPKKSEVYRLLCNNKKFKKATNFKSQLELIAGLKQTIDWYKKNLRKFKNNKFFN